MNGEEWSYGATETEDFAVIHRSMRLRKHTPSIEGGGGLVFPDLENNQ